MTHGNVSWCVVHGYYCRLVWCNCIVWIHAFNVFICYMNSCVIQINCRLVRCNCIVWIHLLHVFIYCMNSCIHQINYSFYPCIILCRHNQSKEVIICDGSTLSYWQNIPWKIHNYPISKEVGLPCYLSLIVALLSLYGKHICLLNQLVITDDEDADYCSFETLILTHELFWSSTVMLHTFHAIWQAFKRDIYHLLP